MKKEKQEVLKKILDSGNYEVDTQTGAIYRKGKFVKPQILPSGYYQHTLFLGRGTGVRGNFYLHQLVFFKQNGYYDSLKTIDHIDGRKSNNRIENLRLISHSDNVKNLQNDKEFNKNERRTVRSEEIKEIRILHSKGISQSRIAKAMDLNRLSVRYTIKKIDAGEVLKYENENLRHHK